MNSVRRTSAACAALAAVSTLAALASPPSAAAAPTTVRAAADSWTSARRPAKNFGARDSTFGYSRSYGIFIGPQAVDPINHNNRVIRY